VTACEPREQGVPRSRYIEIILDTHNLLCVTAPFTQYRFLGEVKGAPAELAEHVYNWIETCLKNDKQHGSFGIILSARFRDIKKPCVLLGFPDPDNFRVPSELPEGISLWVENFQLSGCHRV
jgi:hypothetical protein